MNSPLLPTPTKVPSQTKAPTPAKNQLLQGLQTQLSHHRNRVIRYRLLLSLPLVMLVVVFVYACSHSILFSSLSAVLVSAVICWRLSRSRELAAIHLDNFLLHLNRCYPQLEESAQLISRDPQTLSLLQQLQQSKITTLLSSILAQHNNLPSNDYALKRPVILTVTTAIVLIAAYLLAININWQQVTSSPNSTASSPVVQTSTIPDGISSIQVTVVSPTYSKLATQQSDQLNISLLAGSQVNWLLAFKHATASQGNYAITLSSGEQFPLIPDGSGHFAASAKITQSAIYTISPPSGSAPSGKLDGVFTLSVSADNAPQIRFLIPSTTTTEIPKDGLAELDTEVIVSDDFALSKVLIQASIAKGSGEGVKFRDQDFEFDKVQIIEGKAHYYKHWQLTELGMEPGDEMYFSVMAWDNRDPEPQLTRSPSKIIRWLEEEQSELATDGILLDVLPEYFKSQRQIIIETEQLLVDQPQLTLKDFKRTSTDLGFAQGDLKQKYGQFLGDEFEGASLHSMESGPTHTVEDEEHKKHAAEGAKSTEAEEHEHEHQSEPQSIEDKSGASELIAQYGHNHGEAEIGFTGFKGQPSPTALMKQAIANMWNAESHLMMSEPAQALPYEKQALKFLTQAKKADRIYVKRLGFEPPPVSESRRYQGELKDIKNAQQQQLSPPPAMQTQLLTDSINRLEFWLNNDNNDAAPGLQTEQVKELKTLLMTDLNNSPDNIQHIATLEKLTLDANQLKNDCRSCVSQLQQKLWSLLPAVVAAPSLQSAGYLLSNPAINDYQTFLNQEQQFLQQEPQP